MAPRWGSRQRTSPEGALGESPGHRPGDGCREVSNVSDLQAELLEAFREEYREHLEGIRTALGALEASGGVRGADLEEALRRAHSLKAAARVCDLVPLAALSQCL